MPEEIQQFLKIKNGSVELFFDDEGLLQKVITRKRRRRREGEELKVISESAGTAVVNFDPQGKINVVTYESIWRRETT